MKKFIAGFLTCAILIFTLLTFGFAEDILNVVLNPYPVYVNGSQVEVEGYNINGFTFLKLADVGKCFDSTVSFNQTEKRIEIESNSKPAADNTITPNPTEAPIETIDFLVSLVNREVWVKDSNNITYQCVPAKGKTEQFIVNTTIQGYWDKDDHLFLQNTEGKFIGCYIIKQRQGDD
jgi:hypothetical protein